ncbi:MAG TPA: VCBS repeat-containing protein [Chitinophagaceae bacterium]|nr:VCBS repeat-containing protein [Chitinophagaceae bacterium]
MRRITRFIILVLIPLVFFSCKEKKQAALFEILPASVTKVNFVNKVDSKKDMFNILYYLYYYNGGGVATGDINNDGLVDIFFTANSKGNNKLYINKGKFVFEDVTTKAGVAGTADWCSGVTMADVNADGYLDIYVCASSRHHNLKGSNELFVNNKNGTFTESAAQFGLDFSGFGVQAAFFDYDKDGDLDCYLLNHSQKPNSNIVDAGNRTKYDSLAGDRLYRNDVATTGKFTDVSAKAGIYQSALGYGLGLAVADMNNDGWDDIYIGNDFHENDYYYVNNKNGTFTEEGAKHFRHYSRFSMGNDIADYNNDGQLDIITADMLPDNEKTLKTYGSDENPDTYTYKLINHGYQHQYSKNVLQRNNGNGEGFSETALQSGVAATDWSWSPLFADFDNDGNKDLFISSGIVKRPVDLDYVRFVSDLVMKMNIDETNKFDNQAIDNMPDGASHPYLYKGDGILNFKDVSKEWGTGNMKGYYNGASYADLDNDGNLDVIINSLNSPAVILKNNAEPKYTVDLVFTGNDKNTFGIGAKAWVFTKNKIQYQQLMPTRGFQSSCDLKLHFGLDSIRYIDSILVVWPDQKYQMLKNVPAIPKVIVEQQQAGGVFNYSAIFPSHPELLQNITAQINNSWQHKENAFVDFNVQYLIPHKESTRGPKVAVGDVNKDGLDDMYVCGAKGQSGALLIQTKDGKFQISDSELFNKNAESEETDAIFFDANKDGYDDLYVVSGGNEFENGNPLLADKLYINNRKGNFTSSTTSIPIILTNKSCVTVTDADNDGDNDLFVGGLANARAYGLPQSSYLLINNGEGIFKQADSSLINLKDIGMATTSAWEDINNDGWKDLIVTGEWMPIKIFINDKGKFIPKDILQSSGLWQIVYTTDINGDGFTDILAGNWGHNTKFFAGKNGPLKLYVKDFDKNGSFEQIITYTSNGKEYPFLAKDELERSLPVLKKAYLKYSEVAGKTIDYILYDLFKDYVELKSEVLGSSFFINDGKGNFTRIDLPELLQSAPIFAFLQLKDSNDTQYLSGGNFFDVVPYEGRYDAQALALFSVRKNNITYSSQPELSSITGQVRDIKILKTEKYGKIIVVARNNEPLLFYKQQN